MKKIWAILGKHQDRYVWAGICLLIATFFQMAEPKIIQWAIDGVILPYREHRPIFDPSSESQWGFLHFFGPIQSVSMGLLALSMLYLFIALIRIVTNFASTYLVANATEQAIKNFRERLFKHIQLLPLRFHHQFNRGELIQRCTGDIETLKKFYYEQIIECIRLTGLFISAFYFMCLIHWPYALIAILMMPVIVYNAAQFFVKEKLIWKEHEEASDRLTHTLNENLNGLRVVKAFASEEEEIARFKSRNEDKFKLGLKHLRLHSWFWPFSDFFVHLQFAISTLAGGYYALSGIITPGELASFYLYAVIVSWPLREIGRIVSQYGMAKIALQRIEEVLDEPLETNTGTYIPAQLKGDIRFENVWFSYPDKTEPILKDINFHLPAGQKTAFIGPTGGGKSSILLLLLRMYSPDRGSIFIDNIPIENYDIYWLRRRIGAVFQEAFLFSDTIKSNIEHGHKEGSSISLNKSILISKTDDTLSILNNGIDTLVGEKGITLSGGQKQRVALARTLHQDPDILLLDDTTSAVDNETEFEIQQQIMHTYKNKSVVVISNRIHPINDCEYIYVIKKGMITEHGSPNQLKDMDGYFAKIAAIQLKIADEILND